MILVSVIIPTFNRKEKVCSAIESVLNQTNRSFELVVVDDGSTDATAEFLTKEYQDQLTIVTTSRQGVSAARNIGVSMSTGDWIAFLDSDDIWHPDKLKRQIEFHQQQPAILISQTQEIWIRKGKRVNPRKKHQKPDGDIFLPSLLLCTISPSSVIMTRELFNQFGGFDVNMPACEDYDLWLRITAKHSIGLLNENLLTKYGGHSDQLSQEFPAMDRFRIYSLLKVFLSGELTEAQKKAVEITAREKLKVLMIGAEKRHQDVEPLKDIVNKVFSHSLTYNCFLEEGRKRLLRHTSFSAK